MDEAKWLHYFHANERREIIALLSRAFYDLSPLDSARIGVTDRRGVNLQDRNIVKNRDSCIKHIKIIIKSSLNHIIPSKQLRGSTLNRLRNSHYAQTFYIRRWKVHSTEKRTKKKEKKKKEKGNWPSIILNTTLSLELHHKHTVSGTPIIQQTHRLWNSITNTLFRLNRTTCVQGLQITLSKQNKDQQTNAIGLCKWRAPFQQCFVSVMFIWKDS